MLSIKKNNLKATWHWIKKTLTGYTVTIVTPSSSYKITHRPFQSPTLEKTKTPRSIRGQKYEAVLIDEYLVQENKTLR